MTIVLRTKKTLCFINVFQDKAREKREEKIQQ